MIRLASTRYDSFPVGACDTGHALHHNIRSREYILVICSLAQVEEQEGRMLNWIDARATLFPVRM